jgi:hypothetical protein
MAGYRVTYEVEKIVGTCPIYRLGDKFVIESVYPTEVVAMDKSDAVCMRALTNIDFGLIYQWGNDEIVGHLSGASGECRIACSMPGEPYTPCGYVIFRVSRERI